MKLLVVVTPPSIYHTPTSHHPILCRFKSSPFTTKWIILEMCMVCLMSWPLLSIHISEFISNIMRGACYGTKSRSLYTRSLFIIIKYASDINAVVSALYSLQHWIGKMDLEHVWNYQLVHLYKTQHTILYLCQYLNSPVI